jgi:hypothetical protein
MSREIVAGSTATFTYTPEVAADSMSVQLLDEDNAVVAIGNGPVDSSGATDGSSWVLTLESDETLALLGKSCRLVWTWTYVDGTTTNTVRDVEPFDVVERIKDRVELVVGENTYVTLAEAESYMARRLGTDAWDGSDQNERSAALSMAARTIDAQPLRGRKYDMAQALQFPRVLWVGGSGCPYPSEHERYSSMTRLAGFTGTNEVDSRVKDAQCEEALALLQYFALQDSLTLSPQERGVVQVSIGSFSETYDPALVAEISRRSTKIRSAMALALLQPWLARTVAIR